jgi:putative addiction module killer protein
MLATSLRLINFPQLAAPAEARLRAKAGAPDRNRTCDLQIRNLSLYPAELRALLASSAAYIILDGCAETARIMDRLLTSLWFLSYNDSMKMEIEIKMYETSAGKVPFRKWLNSLDKRDRAIIRNRLERVSEGNFGEYTPLRQGVGEFIIDWGPGYRIYFAKINNIVLLLNAGNKSTQHRDIQKAITYLVDFKE